LIQEIGFVNALEEGIKNATGDIILFHGLCDFQRRVNKEVFGFIWAKE